MKKYLIILILYSTGILANSDIVSKEKLKAELLIILKDLQNYKSENEKEIKSLKSKLNTEKKEFQNYKKKTTQNLKTYQIDSKKKQQKLQKLLKQKKRQKNNQYLKLKKQLIETEKKLQNNTKRYQKIKKSNQYLKKKIIKMTKEPKKVVLYTKQEEVKANLNAPIALPIQNNLPWVEIIVEDNINIYELALRYYGDSSKYKEIYTANKNIIGKNLRIHNGMSLRIPMTTEFDEQPIILNMQ